MHQGVDVFESHPPHGHRTPQQIAEDAGGAFEVSITRRMKIREISSTYEESTGSRTDAAPLGEPRSEKPRVINAR